MSGFSQMFADLRLGARFGKVWVGQRERISERFFERDTNLNNVKAYAKSLTDWQPKGHPCPRINIPSSSSNQPGLILYLRWLPDKLSSQCGAW